MPAQKKQVSASKSKQSKKRVRSMGLGLAVVALLMVGVVSAMALSQQTQDTRSSAAGGKACRDPKGFWYDCTPKLSEYEKSIQQAEQNRDKTKEEKAPQRAVNALVDKWSNWEKFGTTEKKTPTTTGKSQAKIDAENVEAAREKKAADVKKLSLGTNPTNGDNGGSNGSNNNNSTYSAAEIAFTQQFYRELTGSEKSTSDSGFKKNLARVRANDCLAVVKSFNLNNGLKQYNNYEYARRLHRALVSRTFAPDDASNGWVTALGSLSREKLAESIWGHEEPKAACAQRRMITN